MKKKETPFLDFYTKCIKTETMPTNGLCNSFNKNKIFLLVDPDEGEGISYWGFDEDILINKEIEDKWFHFGPLRQNVVLLCAAINNEL